MDISIAKRKGYSLHEQSNNGKISLVRIFYEISIIIYIFYYIETPSIKYIINDKNSNIIPTYNLLSSLDKILIII